MQTRTAQAPPHPADPTTTSTPGEASMVIAVAIAIGFGLLILVRMLRSYLFVCRPNELLVIAGKKHALPSGERANYTVIQAGMHWRVPVMQTVSRMDIRLIPI